MGKRATTAGQQGLVVKFDDRTRIVQGNMTNAATRQLAAQASEIDNAESVETYAIVVLRNSAPGMYQMIVTSDLGADSRQLANLLLRASIVVRRKGRENARGKDAGTRHNRIWSASRIVRRRHS